MYIDYSRELEKMIYSYSSNKMSDWGIIQSNEWIDQFERNSSIRGELNTCACTWDKRAAVKSNQRIKGNEEEWWWALLTFLEKI